MSSPSFLAAVSGSGGSRRCHCLALLLLALATGCDGTVAARGKAVRQPVRTSLRDTFHASHAWPVYSGLDFRDVVEQRFLPWGFHDVTGRWRGPWSKGRAGLIEVPRAASEPLRLTLRVAPYVSDEGELPDQTVQVQWNDRPYGTYPVSALQEIVIDVPAEQVHAAVNRLLLLPRYWVIPRQIEPSGDGRNLGIRVQSLTVTTPRRSLRGADPTVADGALRQSPGSLVARPLYLPEQPVLRGRFRIVRPPAGDEVPGRVTICLEDEAGGFHELARWELHELTADRSHAVEVNLAAWATQPVHLCVGFTVEAGWHAPGLDAAAWHLEWQELAVEGAEPVPAERVAEAARGRHNVVMILFDTLRADRIGPYGGSTATPFLDDLAARGVTFADAQSTSAWTRPAVASLFTALDPGVHGIRQLMDSLPEHAPLLAEQLRDAGYRTLAVLNNPQVSPVFGFGAGFEDVREIHDQAGQWDLPSPAERARVVFDRFMEPFLESRADDEPFFLYLHDIDPHSPYDPPPPFDAQYRTVGPSNLGATQDVADLIHDQAMPLEAADLRWLDSQYRGEIAFMDAFLAHLIERLEAQGAMEDTLLVFLSDHGEEFLEHGGVHHGRTLHGEMLDVPLIFVLEGALPAGRRIDGPVSLTDVAPTILDCVGLSPRAPAQGRSLLPRMFTAEPVGAAHATFASTGVGRSLQRSVRVGDWKLILTGPGPEPTRELYHVGEDPGEQIDRYGERPMIGRVLQEVLAQHEREGQRIHVGKGVARELGDLDVNTLSELRELGYLK